MGLAHYIDFNGDPFYFCPNCGSATGFGPLAPGYDATGNACWNYPVVVGICLDCGHIVEDMSPCADEYTAWACHLRETEPCRRPVEKIKEAVSASQS